ncbi:Lsr2 family protein [Rhodococcus aetherivorans]|uniref:Lsr2 family protein n=1 Tax=Rhodococcus aetherivorans TaxID=191292 RepID=UPI0021AE0738|nr:Lsr2 family protein [Rhodococcus aetherivorans]
MDHHRPTPEARRDPPAPPAAGTRTRRKTVAGTKEQLAAIRAWAKTHGYQVSDRGRIPQHVIDQFEAAHR